MRNGWSGWPWGPEKGTAMSPEGGREDSPLGRARDSLRALVEDPKLPAAVRDGLSEELGHVQAMLERLEQGHVHIALFGRVGVGKSALINALLGERRFSTSPLHGETRAPQSARWEERQVHERGAGGVFLIDTPGIDDIEGEARERMAREVGRRADLVLFVVDGDTSATEIQALRVLAEEHKPLLLVFNKVDRYTEGERAVLVEALTLRCRGLLGSDRIVCTAAEPGPRIYIEIDASGRETETLRRADPQVQALREALWAILESEGKALAALNATLFAGEVSDTISSRVLAIRRDLAAAVIRSYCLVKGVVVGLNPIPISDLLAAGAADVGLVLHLARIYGLPMGKSRGRPAHRHHRGADGAGDGHGVGRAFRRLGDQSRHGRALDLGHRRHPGGRRLLFGARGRAGGAALSRAGTLMGTAGAQARRPGDPRRTRSGLAAHGGA